MAFDIYSQCKIPANIEDFVTDKNLSAKSYFRYFLARCQEMFEWKNLPETIPQSILERYLLMNGIACVTNANDDNLYVFSGNLGGEYDVNYQPELFIVSNPHLDGGFTKEVVILGKNEHTGVLMRSDTEWAGLAPLIARYSYMLAENMITLRSADIMLRIVALITAGTDADKKAADAYLKKLVEGKLSAVGENGFMEGIKMQSPPSNNGSYLTQFLELNQYLIGSFYNEIGLKANYNMKREAIGTGESTLDDDVLLPLCENMLNCRREDAKKINDMFGTSIEVDFSSTWKEKRLVSSIQLLDSVSQLSSQNDSSHIQNDSSQIQNDSSQIQNDSDLAQNASKVADDRQITQDDIQNDLPLDEAVSQLGEDIAEFIEGKEIEDEKPSDSKGENTEE